MYIFTYVCVCVCVCVCSVPPSCAFGISRSVAMVERSKMYTVAFRFLEACASVKRDLETAIPRSNETYLA
jgi:hypothetical protein